MKKLRIGNNIPNLNQSLSNRENSAAYRASRHFKQLRRQLAFRSEGKCERCGYRFEIAHHLTYARYGNERITDMQAVCRACHAFLHGFTDHDPCNDKLAQLLLFDTN